MLPDTLRRQDGIYVLHRVADGDCSAVVGVSNTGKSYLLRALARGKVRHELLGKPPTEQTIATAADLAPTEASPIDDFRGSAEYRNEIIRVLVRRTLETAVSRARGEGGDE